MKLSLQRPLVFFDLEATGLNPLNDRITEICVIKVHPDGERETKTRRLNPTIPISQEASDITGITDDDVKDCPTFPQVAKGILGFIEGCDLSGYNVLRFDVPMLVEEFKRAGVHYDMSDVEIVDAQRIFHKKEARTLEAALRFYCNEDLEGAHAAENDVIATIKVLEGQLEKYDDVPRDVVGIAKYCRDDRWVDTTGRLHWKSGEACIAFGKKAGTSLRELAKSDKGYLNWVLNSDFPQDVKEIITEALAGKFPVKEEEA